MEIHEYANLFPMLNSIELNILAEDIKQNGLIETIKLFDGKIIDGRNRYSACKIANIEPIYETIEPIDTLQYVISTNLKRRHLTESQRAVVAAKLANMNNGQRKTDLNSANLQSSAISVEDASKLLNVSVRSISTAKEVIKKHPERLTEIMEGKKTVSAIAKETRKQDEIEARKEVAKQIIEEQEFLDEKLPIYLGDSVEILKTLPDNSVDCVVMDPPYAISYKDTRESFNPDFEDSPEIILPMLDNCFSELKRVCKSDAHIYCFFGPTETISFTNLIEKHFGDSLDKIPLIWVKNNHTMCDFNSRWANKYEPIFFISNKERKLNYPVSQNVLNYNIPTNKLHKTQKPVDLLEYLIKDSTVEGEVVLDCFCGSGSTLVAAKNCNRKYIGIEKNEDIYNIAIERLKNNI